MSVPTPEFVIVGEKFFFFDNMPCLLQDLIHLVGTISKKIACYGLNVSRIENLETVQLYLAGEPRMGGLSKSHLRPLVLKSWISPCYKILLLNQSTTSRGAYGDFV